MRRRAVVRQEDQRRVAYKNMVRMPGCDKISYWMRNPGVLASHMGMCAQSWTDACCQKHVGQAVRASAHMHAVTSIHLRI